MEELKRSMRAVKRSITNFENTSKGYANNPPSAAQAKTNLDMVSASFDSYQKIKHEMLQVCDVAEVDQILAEGEAIENTVIEIDVFLAPMLRLITQLIMS
jgi:hypothetical protein